MLPPGARAPSARTIAAAVRMCRPSLGAQWAGLWFVAAGLRELQLYGTAAAPATEGPPERRKTEA